MHAIAEIEAPPASALRTRVMTSYALCAIAESERDEGDRDRALDALRMLRASVAEIALRVSEPDSMSSTTGREAVEMLAELRTRLRGLESTLSPH